MAAFPLPCITALLLRDPALIGSEGQKREALFDLGGSSLLRDLFRPPLTTSESTLDVSLSFMSSFRYDRRLFFLFSLPFGGDRREVALLDLAALCDFEV